MRYLIHCGTGIGDVALILPMVKVIKDNDRDAFITVFNNTGKNRFFKTQGLFAIQNYIDSIEYYNAKEIRHSLKFLLKNIFNKYDYAFDIEYEYIDNKRISFWPYLIERFSSKKVCGFEDKNHVRGINYDITIKREKHENLVSTMLKMTSKLGFHILEFKENLFDENKLKHIFESNKKMYNLEHEKYIVLVIGAGRVSTIDKGLRYAEEKGETSLNLKSSGKQWPYNKWVELSQKLDEMGYKVVILGGKEEKEEISRFNLPKTVLNLSGKLELSESVAVINGALLCIGGDTGLMHCAGMCKRKCIMLLGCTGDEHKPFGQDVDVIFLDLKCQPCIGSAEIATCENPKCIKDISIELVLERVWRMINES